MTVTSCSVPTLPSLNPPPHARYEQVKTNLSNAALASKMEATTDMEKEVEMLLTAGGASEAGLAENEMEELKSKVYFHGTVASAAAVAAVVFFVDLGS